MTKKKSRSTPSRIPSVKSKTQPARARPPVDEEFSFREVVGLIEQARERTYQAVNTALIDLYWQIGEYIDRRITDDGWGRGTVAALAQFIRKQRPEISGFSAPNLWRMRQFVDTYRHLSGRSKTLTTGERIALDPQLAHPELLQAAGSSRVLPSTVDQ